jgi:hypothetical protein
MAAIALNCPKCNTKSIVDLPGGESQLGCPECGICLELDFKATFVPVAMADEVEQQVPTEDNNRARKRKKHRYAAWQWAAFVLDFVGWYLFNRGLVKQAIARCKKCLASKPGTQLVKTYARGFVEAWAK